MDGLALGEFLCSTRQRPSRRMLSLSHRRRTVNVKSLTLEFTRLMYAKAPMLPFLRVATVESLENFTLLSEIDFWNSVSEAFFGEKLDCV